MPSFVTRSEKISHNDFMLVGDMSSDLLSKKMEDYPVRVFRDGRVEWNGVLNLAMKCHLNYRRYPFDQQGDTVFFWGGGVGEVGGREGADCN